MDAAVRRIPGARQALTGQDITHAAPWTGVEIRALRQAYRMSVREFAKHLGVSDRMVSKWESGGAAMLPRQVNQAALDTALRRSPAEVQARFAAWPTRTREHAAMVGGRRWVVHLVVQSTNLGGALDLAEAMTGALAHIPRLVTVDTTVSHEDRQGHRFRLFCGRLVPDLPDTVGCGRRHGHTGGCSQPQ